MDTKIKCGCGWKGIEKELLKAPNPYLEDEIIGFCPKCKDAFELLYVCDEPGCWEPRTCGTSTKNGYRHTCGKHKPSL